MLSSCYLFKRFLISNRLSSVRIAGYPNRTMTAKFGSGKIFYFNASQGGTLINGAPMQVPDPSEWREPDFSSVQAIPKTDYIFRAWEREGITVSTDTELFISETLYNTSPNGATFIACFIRKNALNADLGSTAEARSGDFYIEVASAYPLTSDIELQFGARGSWWHGTNVEGERPTSKDFDFKNKIILKAGQNSWHLRVSIESGGWFDSYNGPINWFIYFDRVTDNTFLYELGNNSTGVGNPS